MKMAAKKKTNKELNEELEGLVAKVNDLEKIFNDLVVKLNKKNENQVNIEEIHKKVVAHDSQIDNILITIEKNNDSKDKMKDCQECDLKFKTKSLLRKHTRMEHWTPIVKVCDHCDEIFVEHWELEIHLKMH